MSDVILTFCYSPIAICCFCKPLWAGIVESAPCSGIAGDFLKIKNEVQSSPFSRFAAKKIGGKKGESGETTTEKKVKQAKLLDPKTSQNMCKFQIEYKIRLYGLVEC